MISLCVLALNEEEHLAGLLEKCRPHVDEIVVWVDDRSTDATEDIAQEHADIVLIGAFHQNFARARNLTISMSRGDWILTLDPDERPVPGLLRYFRRMSETGECDAIVSLHENRIDGEPVEGHFLEWHCRFFRRAYRWRGKLHETVDLGEARVWAAPEHLRIHHFKTSERQAMQNMRYAEWDKE